jgi:hypothetical protein
MIDPDDIADDYGSEVRAKRERDRQRREHWHPWDPEFVGDDEETED